MDGDRVDRVARIISAAPTRRGLLALLTALPLAGAVATPSGPMTAMAGRRHRRRVDHRHKHDNRKGKRKGKGKNKGKGGAGAKCLPLGAACDRRRPGTCCSGSCRPPGSAGLPPNIIPSVPGEPHECVEAAFGCTSDVNSCPPTGQQDEVFPCPTGPAGGRCFVNVKGLSFCGGHGGVCEPCDSDRDCVDLHGPGYHCVECEERCDTPGATSFRACFAEGPAAA